MDNTTDSSNDVYDVVEEVGAFSQPQLSCLDNTLFVESLPISTRIQLPKNYNPPLFGVKITKKTIDLSYFEKLNEEVENIRERQLVTLK